MKRALILALALSACEEHRPTSDDVQRQQQEVILQEGTSAVGMPAIKNFRERRMLKDIIELRDQEGLITFTYIWSEMNAKLVFLCTSVGYGIPYATQFTNPQKLDWRGNGGGTYGFAAIPQADPNGLFSPAAAEGTWVLCKDPNGKNTRPLYVEPRVIVSPFKLTNVPSGVQ